MPNYIHTDIYLGRVRGGVCVLKVKKEVGFIFQKTSAGIVKRVDDMYVYP